MYLETVAEFLHSLLKTPSLRVEIIKNMRRNIIDIYMGNVQILVF
jgi:excinuclease UvrABC helicase subunit UvrB